MTQGPQTAAQAEWHPVAALAAWLVPGLGHVLIGRASRGAVIGVTIIAFGTSLPELATCIAAAAKRHTDIIVGNIVGSNVFNILSIIGITALVEPLHVDPSLGGIDMWVMVGSSVLFALWLLRIGPITRLVGAVCVVAYCAFVVSQFGDVLSEWLFGGSAAAATSG